MANGIEQKGIDTLQQCIKKCATAGLGIPATVHTSTQVDRLMFSCKGSHSACMWTTEGELSQHCSREIPFFVTILATVLISIALAAIAFVGLGRRPAT